MKTRNILITLGMAAFAAITINAAAGNIALSPRAAGNHIQHASDVSVAQTAPATGVALSPRAAGNQVVTVANTDSGVTTAMNCAKYMTGSSPKAIQACAANPASAMPCCAVATSN
jgi:hypothetical protein